MSSTACPEILFHAGSQTHSRLHGRAQRFAPPPLMWPTRQAPFGDQSPIVSALPKQPHGAPLPPLLRRFRLVPPVESTRSVPDCAHAPQSSVEARESQSLGRHVVASGLPCA